MLRVGCLLAVRARGRYCESQRCQSRRELPSGRRVVPTGKEQQKKAEGVRVQREVARGADGHALKVTELLAAAHGVGQEAALIAGALCMSPPACVPSKGKTAYALNGSRRRRRTIAFYFALNLFRFAPRQGGS